MRLKLLVVLIVILIYSCGKRRSKVEVYREISHLVGRRIIFPESLVLYANDSTNEFDKDYFLKNRIKIVSIIDGDCGVCLDELGKWEKLIMNNLFPKASYVFIIKSFNQFETFKYLVDDNLFYPLFLDVNNDFFNGNRIPQDKRYQTFLLDETNKIRLVGNPVYSKEIEKFYKDFILINY